MTRVPPGYWTPSLPGLMLEVISQSKLEDTMVTGFATSLMITGEGEGSVLFGVQTGPMTTGFGITF